jgi:hypothetical protein
MRGVDATPESLLEVSLALEIDAHPPAGRFDRHPVAASDGSELCRLVRHADALGGEFGLACRPSSSTSILSVRTVMPLW